MRSLCIVYYLQVPATNIKAFSATEMQQFVPFALLLSYETCRTTVNSIKFFFLFFLSFSPMPPHVLMNFRGFPPGCGDSVADFSTV